MTNLCKILETVYGTYPENYGGSPTKEQHNQAHQQILALIPKKSNEECAFSKLNPSGICSCNICTRDKAISEITHRLEGV